MKITAAVARAPGAPFSIESLELESPRADEVLVRMVSVGLCHTDLSVRDQMIPLRLPAVLGHEGAGIVERVGSAVTTVKPNDRVLLSFRSCGTCDNCRAKLPSYCDGFMPLNFSGTRPDGSYCISAGGEGITGNFFGQSSFASHAIAYERNVLKVPDEAPLELLAPLGCGIQTGAGTVMNVLKARPGSSIAVFGGGAVGLSAVLAAVFQQCKTIIVVEPVESRRRLAKELGATHTIDPRTENTATVIRQIVTAGIDYAADTTAVPAALEAAAQSLAVRGKLALVGVPPKPETSFALNVLQTVSIGATICGTVEGDCDPAKFIPQLIELNAQGRFPFERLISLYPFADINRAIDDHHHGRCVKAVLRF
jgi:aryl-alcohol dehydrogenase